jgi:hypothetical protein
MQSKWIMMSKTVWGVILMALGGAAQFLGWTWWADVQGDATTIFNLVLEIAGAILAIVGRVKAGKPVTALPK